eukprot:2592763-Amphidinium_carterae.1
MGAVENAPVHQKKPRRTIYLFTLTSTRHGSKAKAMLVPSVVDIEEVLTRHEVLHPEELPPHQRW